MTDMPPPRVNAPGKRLAIVLAVVVHLALVAFLVYGIRWQTKVRDVVEVELVRETPAPLPSAPEPPEPAPVPKTAVPPPPKPEPKPTPPAKPDIAVKAPEPPKPPPKEAPKVKPDDPLKRQMLEEERRLATAKQIAEEERKLAQHKAAQAASQAAAARDKALASYTDRIRAKIRGNIVLPPDLKGNPSAVFEVAQLPSGEVMSARLVKSSGHAGYDAAVERAILKSSPLPKPDDAGLFERNLRLIFCPLEDGKCA